jgi:hypothetical protein
MKNPFKIDKTNLILDEDKIRNCTTNLNKMSVGENMIFDYKNFKKLLISFYAKNTKDFVIVSFRLFWTLLCTITFPIILFIRACITKYQAKKEIEAFNANR